MTSDERMTWDLIFDVFDVLDRHGYHRRDNQHTGQAVGMIRDLARIYEGSLDHPFGPYINEIPPSRAEPAPPEPGRPRTPSSSSRSARSRPCPGRPGHSRRLQTRPRRDSVPIARTNPALTCESRLRDAQAYRPPDRLS